MADTQPMAPTDAEIETLWQDSYPNRFEAISFARAILAKWGAQQAPAQAAPAAVAGPSLYQIMAVAKAIHETTTDADDWDALRQCEIDALRGRAEKVLAALATAPTTQPALQQGAGKVVHQFRKQHCADWYDGHADHGDGGGPYEERTLYTAPQPVASEPLTPEQVVDAFCKQPHTVQFVEAFIKGVRFAEQYHGIKGGQHGAE